MYYKTQKFLVLGVSKSGYSVAEYLLKNHAVCYVYEQFDTPKIKKSLETLLALGAIEVITEKANECIDDIDVLVISPGVPINHELAVLAKRKGKRVIGELEFGFLQFSPPTIAVTGTNGKTTTVSMVKAILDASERKSILVGNIGVPITSKLTDCDAETICVAEVSSFQLEGVNLFCPHVSCILNIAPDHLERHYTMENYIYLKKRIFKNQRESEFTVLNFDDLTVRSFFTETKAKVVWVSSKEKVEGVYQQNGKLYYYDEYVMDVDNLSLKGEHNLSDALFAIACAKIMGVETDIIARELTMFRGVRHRIELVCEKEGVKYYNDSKATNTSSTLSAIKTMSTPTVLILGGSEKGESYDALFSDIKSSMVKHVVITGASRYNMLESAGRIGVYNVTITPDFYCAVKIAKMMANQGDSILLSPACASFDSFSGFEERGEAFCKVVEGIDGEENVEFS